MCLGGGGGSEEKVPYWSQVFFRSQDWSWHIQTGTWATIPITMLGAKPKMFVMPPNWLKNRTTWGTQHRWWAGLSGTTQHLVHSLPPKLKNGSRPPPKFYLTYMRFFSERVERKYRSLGIRTTFKSKGTLREALVQTKEPKPKWKNKGIVYQIQCAEFDSVYITETGRALAQRLSEHKGTVKRYDVKDGIVVHAWAKQYKLDWQVVTVKHVETKPLREEQLEQYKSTCEG